MTRLLTEPARPQAVREHRLAPWFAVGSVCVGAFMGQLDASIVTLAFPALQREFHASLAAAQWVSLGYLLALGRAARRGGPPGGRGRAQARLPLRLRVFTRRLGGVWVRALAGALVGFRVVQAAGAAMLQANSVALVVTSVPRARMRAGAGRCRPPRRRSGLALGPPSAACWSVRSGGAGCSG